MNNERKKQVRDYAKEEQNRLEKNDKYIFYLEKSISEKFRAKLKVDGSPISKWIKEAIQKYTENK